MRWKAPVDFDQRAAPRFLRSSPRLISAIARVLVVPLQDIGDAFAALPAVVPASVAIMVIAQRVVARLGLWPYAVFALPGTLAHELAHWVVAWLLRAQPQRLDLVPRRTASGWRLGSVAFRAPWWRAGPIALAPLLLAPAALAWLLVFAAPATGMTLLLHAWITATLAQACLPSRTDLRVAAPFLVLVAIVSGVAVALVASSHGGAA